MTGVTQALPTERELRRNPCAACGLCCRSYLVPVFGHDLYRLVKRRNLDPRTFIFACEQEQPDKVGFRLCGDGPTYGLALDKKEKLEVNQPCVFLVEDADGTSRCGVYDDRPVACASYPMVRALDRVVIMTAALCPSDAWDANEVDKPQWLTGLRRLARYRDTYIEVVNRWNAWIASDPEPSRPAEHFVAYVLQVYDRLAALDAELGDEAVSAVERTWGMIPSNTSRGDRDGEPNWIAYLRRARATIDQFFPDLPPLPFARISI